MDFWRQADIFEPINVRTPVTVIGAGGIGSPTTLALAKMGLPTITVYDDDSVESHNLPNQMYRTEDLGGKKVDALAAICQDFAELSITTVPERLDGQQISGIVISGVDSMTSRQDIWKRVKLNPQVELYIDARMGAEVCRIYSVNPCTPSEYSYYESTMYADESAIEAACTARAIIYNVFVIAGLVCNNVKKHLNGEQLRREIVFDLATMTLIKD